MHDTSGAAPSSVIIGTAGHIDHGKTTLVRALTGVDTDRLDEEKRRGITIVLGFAPLQLGGRVVGVVDVPGHERFVRTMVAGAGGVDVGLLVVAADEGVMPQTREHLDILRLLRVPELVVALTRIDATDPELAELAELDARDLLEGSPWPDAPVLAVSGLTGQGIEGLRAALAAAVERLPARARSSVFRMPADRCFTIRGFGTVVTGTTRDGALQEGATLEVLPGHKKVKIRGMQVHGADAERVGPGQRVALNLQGTDPDAVPAGSWLATPGALACADRIDVELAILPGGPRPLANNARVRFLYGTAEVLATVRLMADDGGPAPDELRPGERAFAQLALEEEVGAVAGDRFVLRSESPLMTLGGGHILDPSPPRLRRRERLQASALLSVLASPAATAAQRIAALLARHAGRSIDLAELRRRLPPIEDLLAVARSVPDAVALRADPPAFTSRAAVARWIAPTEAFVAAHHAAHPLLDGPLLAEVRQALVPPPEPRVFEALLPALAEGSALEPRGPRLAREDHRGEPDAQGSEALNKVVARLAAGGVHPPPLAEVLDGLKLPPDGLPWLVQRGAVLRVTDDFYVARAPFVELIGRIDAHVQEHGPMGPTDFKELSGLTRRHAMPFLEFLDRERITVRAGNGRTLHEDAAGWTGPAPARSTVLASPG